MVARGDGLHAEVEVRPVRRRDEHAVDGGGRRDELVQRLERRAAVLLRERSAVVGVHLDDGGDVRAGVLGQVRQVPARRPHPGANQRDLRLPIRRGRLGSEAAA